MISLKNFRNVSDEELALRNIVSLLMEKMGSAAVKSEAAGHEAYCAEIEGLRRQIEDGESPAVLSLAAGSAVQSMEIYNIRVTEMLQRQNDEFGAIVSMIAETARKMGGENVRSAQRLQEIGNSISSVGSLPDIDTVRSHVSDCLRSFREELDRHRAESNAVVQSLQRGAEHGENATAAIGLDILDPVTGLRQRPAAMVAMQAAMETGERLCVAVMVVRGVESVNSRFGTGVGDRMMNLFKENIETQLTRDDRLFRWNGTAILALLKRDEPIGQVRANFRRMLERRIEESFDVDGRTVMIPIGADSLTFLLVSSVAIAAKQIQAFAGGKPV